MSAHDTTLMTPIARLPGILRSEWNSPILPRRGWRWTIAPAYAGLFVAAPMLDRLGTQLIGNSTDAARHQPNLVGAAIMALLAVLACELLIHDPLARWGGVTRSRLGLTGASAFGTQGSEWITGIGVALGALVSYAVAIHIGLRFVFLGLLACGLIDAEALRPWVLGPIVLESPSFILAALFWIFIIGMTVVLNIPSVIFSLMQIYTPVAMLLLVVTAVLTSDGLALYFCDGASLPGFEAGSLARLIPGRTVIVQLVFGAFAMSGLFAVEWGAAVRRRADIRMGGWVGIVLAGSFATVLSLLIVAGALGKVECGQPEPFPAADVLTVPFSLHWAIHHGIGGPIGGAILMLLGLASLAPACYSAWTCAQRLAAHAEWLKPSAWTWISVAPVLLLVSTSWAGELETIFSVLGAFFAPVAAVIAADAISSRFRWTGIRQGWNPPGLVAWVCGLAVGLWMPGRFGPAAVWAYAVAAAIYLTLAAMGAGLPVESSASVAPLKRKRRFPSDRAPRARSQDA